MKDKPIPRSEGIVTKSMLTSILVSQLMVFKSAVKSVSRFEMYEPSFGHPRFSVGGTLHGVS